MLRSEQIEQLALDCVYFKSDQPCRPHLHNSLTCRCATYCPITSSRLIIQLSSPAQVIRSAALVDRIKNEDPNCRITYLTPFVELLHPLVDEPLPYDAGGVLRCQMEQFDYLYNLDLDKRACAVSNLVNAENKKGFFLRNGHCHCFDRFGQSQFLKTVLPRTANAAPRHWLRDLFALCGLEYRGERPRLHVPNDLRQNKNFEGFVVGLNTTIKTQSRTHGFWETARWVKLIEMLENLDIKTVLLGDNHAANYNRQIAEQSQTEFHCPQNLQESLAIISGCDIVVSVMSKELEMALALAKQVVLLQDRDQIATDFGYLRGRGIILEASDIAGQPDSLAQMLPDELAGTIKSRLEHLCENNLLSSKSGFLGRIQANLTQMRETIATSRRRPT